MQVDKVVRSVDIGYGNTKFVVFHNPSEAPICSLFPSLAPQASAAPDLGAVVMQKRNTVLVNVEGVTYEVGKDSKLAQDASHGRVLDPAYSMTDSYIALLRGALYYMAMPVIDMLVLGLPINTFEKYHESLAKRALGTHEIPDPNAKPGSKATMTVEVKGCRVLPQPIGAFFDYATQSGLYGQMKTQMNLLIDPGYYTLDWLTAHGVKMVNARSGAHSGGMSAILQTMAEAIGKDIGTQITDVSIIDDAIRNGTKPRFYGKEMDITEYIKLGKAKAKQFVSVLANKVGSGVDIDNIILAGGGAHFFKDLIEAQYPHHKVVVANEPVFANVRGFQHAGFQWVAGMTKH